MVSSANKQLDICRSRNPYAFCSQCCWPARRWSWYDKWLQPALRAQSNSFVGKSFSAAASYCSVHWTAWRYYTNNKVATGTRPPPPLSYNHAATRRSEQNNKTVFSSTKGIMLGWGTIPRPHPNCAVKMFCRYIACICGCTCRSSNVATKHALNRVGYCCGSGCCHDGCQIASLWPW